MGKSLLTLDTLEPDRDHIDIDEKSYPLRAQGELSLVQIARIGRWSKEIAEWSGGDVDETAVVKVEENVNAILDLIVVGLEAGMRDKLTFNQKFQIVQVFTEAASQKRKATAAVEPIEKPTMAN